MGDRKDKAHEYLHSINANDGYHELESEMKNLVDFIGDDADNIDDDAQMMQKLSNQKNYVNQKLI